MIGNNLSDSITEVVITEVVFFMNFILNCQSLMYTVPIGTFFPFKIAYVLLRGQIIPPCLHEQ